MDDILTVFRWSPHRPAVFAVGKSDGGVDVWDLLDKSHVPSLSQTMCPSAITTIEFLPSDFGTGAQLGSE